MAANEPIVPAADAPVVVIPEANQESYQNLIKACTNRLHTYLTTDRPNSARTGISSIFSTSGDFDNASKKQIEVDNLKNLIGQWQPSNADSTKRLLYNLSIIADQAQKGVFLPKLFVKSNLAKAIEDVKDLIWHYLILNKPDVKTALVQEHQKLLIDAEKHEIKNLPADEMYKIPNTNTNKFKNKGEQLKYEAAHLYPSSDTARNALYEAQRNIYRQL